MTVIFRWPAVALFAALGIGCVTGLGAPAPPPPSLTSGEVDAPPPQEVQVGVQADTYADTDPSALTDFRAALDPHGVWVDDPTYGTVWVPNAEEVGTDFMPYVSGGQWAYDTDYVWMSDYAWGWVPFHYGRWVWILGRGWAWIPGRLYAGAWVVWRLGDDDYGYVAWAPMPPAWIWWGGVALGLATTPPERFVFCPQKDVFTPGVAKHVAPPEQAAVIAGHTHPYVLAGPTVNGNPLAQPVMRGPSPAALGIELSRVPHPSGTERSLLRAQQFAKPSTAQTLGAHPAVPHIVRTVPRLILPNGPQGPRAPHAGGRHR